MAIKSRFPENLVVKILLRMPVKSILRCKTLSKHYYSLIRSQFFIRQHLRLTRLNNKLFDKSILSPILGSVRLFDREVHSDKFLEGTPSIVERSSNDNGHYQEVQYVCGPVGDRMQYICGPVDGLYCLIETKNVYAWSSNFIVWNPATREHIILPLLPKNGNNFGKNPSQIRPAMKHMCILGFGFGYDSNTNDYKVIVMYTAIPNMFFIELGVYFYIFNVSGGEWRKCEECPGIDPTKIGSHVGVFVHGACHWVCTPPRSKSSGFDFSYTILAYDMSRETHRYIPLPLEIDRNESSTRSIVTFNGCLALINSRGGDMYRRSSSFILYVMVEYEDVTWVKFYQVVRVPGAVGRFLGIVGDRFYGGNQEGKLDSINLHSKDAEDYDILHSNIRYMVPYEESLVRIVAT